MLGDEQEKINKIEDLKRKLFSKSYDTKIEYRDGFPHQVKVDVQDSWENEEEVKQKATMIKTSLFKKFFIFSVVFFVVSALYVSFVFLRGGNNVSNENIDISVLGNNFTEGGEDLSLIIGITNKNPSALDLVDLVVEYPRGTKGDKGEDTERQRVSLGTIPSGAVRNEDIKVVLYGEQGSLHDIKISLEYRIAGSNAIFEKNKNYQVSINSTPIDLILDAPTEVSPNQEFKLKAKATLNSTKGASKVLVKMDYPPGFQFISAKPNPAYGNNVWNLGDMAPGAVGDIEIIGKMVDVFDGEEKTFHVSTGSQSDSDKTIIGVIFNSLGHLIAIKKPFIETKIFVNNTYAREYAANSTSQIKGEIHWVNNLDTEVNDFQVKVHLYGNALNRKTINNEEGFYDSSTDTIIWDKNYVEDFRKVKPNESGVLYFYFSPLVLFSGVSGILTDPLVNIEVNITGRQLVDGNIYKDIISSDSKIVKIISDLALNTKVLYYSGPFQNIGPIPPKIEKETTYTVHWSISNTANNISNAKVRSTLPPWVKFNPSVVSPPSSDLTYNSSTREIVWNAGKVGKGAGLSGANKEVYFQISFIPSFSQVGSTPTMINDATLTAHDDFANVDLSFNKGPLSTRLEKDKDFPSNGGAVIE